MSDGLDNAALLALVAIVPLVVLMLTSFVKISVVLALLRNAIGAPDAPSGLVVLGLSLVLTFFVMAPVGVDMIRAAGAQGGAPAPTVPPRAPGTRGASTPAGLSPDATSTAAASAMRAGGTQANAPAGTPRNASGGTPANVSAGTPGNVSAGTPGSIAAGTPRNVSGGTPANVSAGTHGNAAARTPDSAAAAGSAGIPGNVPAGSPGNVSAGAPGTGSAGTPASVFAGTPGNVFAGTPANVSAGTPGSGTAGTPGGGAAGGAGAGAEPTADASPPRVPLDVEGAVRQLVPAKYHPQVDAAGRALAPLEAFLARHADARDRETFVALAHRMGREASGDELWVLAPAFLATELREAFAIAVLIFLPFLVIDLVVGLAIAALGLATTQPQTIALPLKLLLFVAVDGWRLLIDSLLRGYA